MSADAPLQPQTVQAAVEGAVLADAVVPIKFEPGTVIGYSEAPPARVMVLAETARTAIGAKNLTNQPLLPGARVMLAWAPPAGCYVLAPVGRMPPPYGLWRRTSTLTIADNTETDLTWTANTVNYGGLTEAAGVVALPFTGLWAPSCTVHWASKLGNSPQSRQKWVRIDRLDMAGTYIETMAEEWRHAVTPGITNTGDESYCVSAAAWPCKAGDQMRVRVYQNSPNYGFGNDPLSFDVTWANFAVEWVGMSTDIVP